MSEIITTQWTDLPENEYDVVYADPPWMYDGDPNGYAAAAKHYQLMTLEQLIAIPVRTIMKKKSVLMLWATCPKLDVAMDLIRGWGLHYRGVAKVWVKTKQNGAIMGAAGPRPSFVKPTTELLLVASTKRSGRTLPLLTEKMSQILMASRPQNVHSKKPDVVRDQIVELFGDVRRIELFARTSAPGWDAWGNEVPVQTTLEGQENEQQPE